MKHAGFHRRAGQPLFCLHGPWLTLVRGEQKGGQMLNLMLVVEVFSLAMGGSGSLKEGFVHAEESS